MDKESLAYAEPARDTITNEASADTLSQAIPTKSVITASENPDIPPDNTQTEFVRGISEGGQQAPKPQPNENHGEPQQSAEQHETKKVVIDIGPTTVHVRYENRDYNGKNLIKEKEEELRKAVTPEEYGEILFTSIVNETPSQAGEGDFTTLYGFRRAIEDSNKQFITEIVLDPNELSLCQYKWEYLKPPNLPNQKKDPIFLNERAPAYRRLQGIPQNICVEVNPLNILVVISNPPALGQPGNTILDKLEPIDIEQERAILETALKRLQDAGVAEYTILDQNVTPTTIQQALKNVHILHIISHGAFLPIEKPREYFLIMDRDNDKHQPFISVNEFQIILQAGPRLSLVILSACQSAGKDTVDVLQGLGPLLVGYGIPAVIAMQDKISVEVTQYFTQYFYDNLARSGCVDKAMAATRSALASFCIGRWNWEWGWPVLLMSAQNGQIFKIDSQNATKLKPLTPNIKSYSELPGRGDPVLRRAARELQSTNVPSSSQEMLTSQIPGTCAAPPAYVPDILQQQRQDLTERLKTALALDPAGLQTFIEQQQHGLKLPETLYGQIASALNTGKHIILIGPPGTGKTSLAHDICAYACERNFAAGMLPATATADWTTFDTVGGYAPTPQQTLQFRPGLFLRALCLGQWLIIDEINRAEIDKAFGELFTVLSGQQVELPYMVGNQHVRIVPPLSNDPTNWLPEKLEYYDYVIHPNWRILATMNVYDKSYLFAMSFAFMRRFAFIDVELPQLSAYQKLYTDWLKPPGNLYDAFQDRFNNLVKKEENPLMKRRELGPAIVKDMIAYLADRAGQQSLETEEAANYFAEAFLLYVAPQLDGLDQTSILDIYKFAEDTLFLGQTTDVKNMVRQRIEALYPHIPQMEWIERQRNDQPDSSSTIGS